jgi:hypothetical protein
MGLAAIVGVFIDITYIDILLSNLMVSSIYPTTNLAYVNSFIQRSSGKLASLRYCIMLSVHTL